MCKLWTNYAKYGEPTPRNAANGDGVVPVIWTPVKPVNKNETANIDFLEIGNCITMRINPDQDRINFWRKEFTKRNGSFLKPRL